MSWIKGRHTLLFGFDFRNCHFTSTNSANSRGVFSVTGAYTGNAFADFLTRYPFSASRDFPRIQFGETDRRYHMYFQDDWKASSRLTLNIGLRYELNRPPNFLRSPAARFDFDRNVIEVERLDNGNINLTPQQVAQYARSLFRPPIVVRVVFHHRRRAESQYVIAREQARHGVEAAVIRDRVVRDGCFG